MKFYGCKFAKSIKNIYSYAHTLFTGQSERERERERSRERERERRRE
jgi:hypothetical protein